MRYKSADGLCESADPNAVVLWDSIGKRMENDKRDWTTRLREMGVKLAHPDDGWVHRNSDPPYLSMSWYPQFNDNPQVGDLIALGCPPRDEYYREYRTSDGVEVANYGYRLVRVTEIKSSPYTDYYFENLDTRVPARPPAPVVKWWQKFKRKP